MTSDRAQIKVRPDRPLLMATLWCDHESSVILPGCKSLDVDLYHHSSVEVFGEVEDLSAETRFESGVHVFDGHERLRWAGTRLAVAGEVTNAIIKGGRSIDLGNARFHGQVALDLYSGGDSYVHLIADRNTAPAMCIREGAEPSVVCHGGWRRLNSSAFESFHSELTAGMSTRRSDLRALMPDRVAAARQASRLEDLQLPITKNVRTRGLPTGRSRYGGVGDISIGPEFDAGSGRPFGDVDPQAGLDL
jgi:hypothetical protein